MTEMYLVNTFPASDAGAPGVDMLWTLDEDKADRTVTHLLALSGDEHGPRYISEADHRSTSDGPCRSWVVRKLRVTLDSEPSDLPWT